MCHMSLWKTEVQLVVLNHTADCGELPRVCHDVMLTVTYRDQPHILSYITYIRYVSVCGVNETSSDQC